MQAKSLGRDRGSGGLLAYNIRSMVQAGKNTIEIRLIPPLSPDAFGWQPQLALDGSALFRDGSRLGTATGPSTDWQGRIQDRDGAFRPYQSCTVMGRAHVVGTPWPSTVYRGIAHDPYQLFYEKLDWVVGSVVVTWVITGITLVLATRQGMRRGQTSKIVLAESCGSLARFFLPPLSVLAAALLVESSWIERHEAILFRIPRVWPMIFMGVAASPLLLSRPALAIAALMVRLPRTRAWYPLIGLILVLCGALRAYKLDFQPLDDDEYASCQGVVAIAREGTPKFVPDGVYYTRSPFYHYFIGAIVWVFGDNLWAMRLPTVMFGVATALMIYRTADKLMKRPWVGVGAMFFFTIHPFAIFSSHLVRFYQQQQFCSLVAVYWFCEGFLYIPSQKHRYLAIFAFFAAVLSQEITAIMAFQLALGLFLFGREAGWPANIKLILIGIAAVSLIVMDLIIFQTWCLTRTEGVSPNVEASIKPHFWDPYNLVSLFLGYSRLHVGPTIALLLSTPLLVKRGGRVVWALAFFMLTGVLLTNLMVTHVSLRYQYWMIPLLLLLSFRGLGLLAERVAVWTRATDERDVRPIAAALCVPIFIAFFLGYSPWRIIDSYDCKILNDSTGAFRYVYANLRPGDAVAANEPHPHAAHMEAGRATYDLTVPMLQDFVMLQKGRMVDRNAGAEVIGSIDDLMEACRTHERLWVVVNREKFRTRGKNLRWEYPGARLELYLRKNFQVAHRTYLWTVFLWDRSRGQYTGFRGQ